jgi:TonB family protein
MLGPMRALAALLLLASPALAQTVPWREAPKLALDTRLAGTVVVEALVDSSGAVAAAGIARSNPALDDAAIARVRAMRFEPLHEHGADVASLRQVPVVFEAPPENGPADTWAAEHCAESNFSVDIDVRPDSSGLFAARWTAKGLKSQELYVIVLIPDGAVLDTTGQFVPQQLADGEAAPAWTTWHRLGRDVRKGTSGTISFTLPDAPWWNLGRVAVVALFHDTFDNRSVVRQKAWRIDRDAMGPMLVGDPGPVPCAAGPWRQGM